MKRGALARAAAVNLAARVGLALFGFVQLMLIARTFGVSTSTDAYLVAVWIPLFFLGLGDSVLVYTLVPYLSSLHATEGAGSVRRVVDSMFGWFILLVVGLSLAVFAAAPMVVTVMAPGFSSDARVLTVDLLRLMSPAVILGGLAAFAASILYTENRFTVAAIAALLPDVGAIGLLLWGGGQWGISAVALGFLGGSVAQVLLLGAELARGGTLPRLSLRRSGSFGELIRLMGPRAGGVGLNRAVIAVDRFFASLIGSGSVSVLAYSFRITQVPVMLLASALGKTVMPTLSRELATGNLVVLRQLAPRAIGFVLFIFAPLVLLFIHYSELITRVLFERGAFTTSSTEMTARVLVYYGLAIPFQSIGMLFSGLFYASGDTWTPFKVTCWALILNAALDFTLMRMFGLVGIALATCGVACFSMLMLYRRLTESVGPMNLRPTLWSAGKIAVATVAMGATLRALSALLGPQGAPETLAGTVLQTAGLSLLSWFAFLLVCRVLRLEEYLVVAGQMSRRLGLVRGIV